MLGLAADVKEQTSTRLRQDSRNFEKACRRKQRKDPSLGMDGNPEMKHSVRLGLLGKPHATQPS
jgi:hypothetical protein